MVEFATPLSNDKDHVDAYHDNEPLCYHTLDNIFGDQPIPRLAMHVRHNLLLTSHSLFAT